MPPDRPLRTKIQWRKTADIPLSEYRLRGSCVPGRTEEMTSCGENKMKSPSVKLLATLVFASSLGSRSRARTNPIRQRTAKGGLGNGVLS
jgi:hypothetical protein